MARGSPAPEDGLMALTSVRQQPGDASVTATMAAGRAKASLPLMDHSSELTRQESVTSHLFLCPSPFLSLSHNPSLLPSLPLTSPRLPFFTSPLPMVRI